MKVWIPRIWLALICLLFLASIPACLGSSAEDGGWMNWTGKQSAFDAKGPLARQQIDTFYVTLWVTGFLFVTVGGVYAAALWKFRARPTDDPNEIPSQAHGHPLIEVGLVAASAGLLVVIAIPTFAGIVMMKKVPDTYAPEDIIEVNVIGYQWWFNFEYPDEGFYSANELVIPVGKAVKLNLETKDVIHSFWLPKLSGKTDLMAGQINTMWIAADEAGYYWGQCAEFCGDSHAYMLFRTVALPEEEYATWVAQQKTATVAEGSTEPLHLTEDADRGLVEHGAALFQEHCLRCHSLDPARQGVGAPNLAHFASRSSIAAGWYENDWSEGNEELHKWILEPAEVKPGNNMWRGFMATDGVTVQMEGLKDADLTESDVDALVAYLRTLQHPEAIQFSPDYF
ncbi:MAG: cytochrome c oxidase subunit II [Verrucomicrobiota bacterium]